MKKVMTCTIAYRPEDHFPHIHPNEPKPSPFDSWNVGLMYIVSNCFAFACNARPQNCDDPSFGVYRVNMPRPGSMGDNTLKKIEKHYLKDALKADGYIYIKADDQKDITVPDNHYLVAAYVAPGQDYHFYRRHEPTKCWYHKTFDSAVTTIDWNGKVIRDPKNAHRAIYTDFAGFYLVPEPGINLDFSVEYVEPKQPRPSRFLRYIKNTLALVKS